MKITTMSAIIFLSFFAVASYFSPVQARYHCPQRVGHVSVFFAKQPHLSWENSQMHCTPVNSYTRLKKRGDFLFVENVTLNLCHTTHEKKILP